MAVFRVEKNKGYTVMSNHHLRNKELSLKAKGLLSQMLSLPEDWDYTLAGLSLINRESIDAIRTAVWELEKAGYITRRQGRDEKGKMTAIEYTIYEQPQPPALDCPVLENPTADKPILENPTPDNPTSENPTQLNKEIQKTNLPKKEKLNTDISSTHSIPFHSLNPSPLEDAAQLPERKRKEATDAYSVYEEIIKDNIEYDYLIQDRYLDRDRIEEILALILETVCTKRRTIRIAGDDHPAELVKAKFMKLNSEHIRFVLDCMQENTTKIRNIKQYMKAALFNAPSTIGSYYTSLVSHDNVVFLDLFFQLAIISVKGFFLRLELPVFFLHGGEIGELGNARRFQCLCRRFMEYQTAFIFCPVCVFILCPAVCFIDWFCLLIGGNVLHQHRHICKTLFHTL